MFYTLTFDDAGRILEDHETLAEAEAFAGDVAGEGYDCAVLQTLSVVAAQPHLCLPDSIPACNQ